MGQLWSFSVSCLIWLCLFSNVGGTWGLFNGGFNFWLDNVQDEENNNIQSNENNALNDILSSKHDKKVNDSVGNSDIPSSTKRFMMEALKEALMVKDDEDEDGTKRRFWWNGSGSVGSISDWIWRWISYKPPVGLTMMFITFSFLSPKQKYKSLQQQQEDINDIEMNNQAIDHISIRQKRPRYSSDLDTLDRDYDKLGGVLSIRTHFTQLALQSLVNHQRAFNLDADNHVHEPFNTEGANISLDWDNLESLSHYAMHTQNALSISALPRSSRFYFLQRLARALFLLQPIITATTQSAKTPLPFQEFKFDVDNTGTVSEKEMSVLISFYIWKGTLLSQVRALDACLRILRDRLLASAARLSRAQSLWEFRVQYYHQTPLGKLLHFWLRKPFFKASLSSDRTNLQLTTATLQHEMLRLGQVQQLLSQQPPDLPNTILLRLKRTTALNSFNDDETDQQNTQAVDPLLNILKSHAIEENENENEDRWTIKAQTWAVQSQQLIQHILLESMMLENTEPQKYSKINNDDQETSNALQHAKQLNALSEWSNQQNNQKKCWDTVIRLVDGLCKMRKQREQTYLKKTLPNIRSMLKRLDVYHIPSSTMTLALAVWVHYNVYIQHWPNILESSKSVAKALWGIVEFRFYIPARDIILDLLNRRPKLLDPFSLENEEMSLDNMLRDLGIGDGKKENRAEALAEATRMYEKELANGAIKNLIRGKMVRLMLIQIQQLKAGMLQAMGSIDDLVDSNRLNVQLLASLPAFILISFGSRLFFAALVAFRSKRTNLRGLSTVHEEMSTILSKMERCLLMASTFTVESMDEPHNNIISNRNAQSSSKTNTHSTSSQGSHHWDLDNVKTMDGIETDTITQQNKELGEFMLYAHSYLVLLDYITPPIQKHSADYIHNTMQDLFLIHTNEYKTFNNNKLSTMPIRNVKRQLALLQLLSTRHAELMKAL